MMSITVINLEREYIRRIQDEQNRIPYLALVNKIKEAGSIRVLSKKELENYIFYERLEYEKNVILLNVLEKKFDDDTSAVPFKNFFELVHNYLIDIISNPIGYTRIEDIHDLLNNFTKDKRINDDNFYMHILTTIDPDKPLKSDAFNNHPEVINKLYQYYNYLLLRKKFDYCKAYCEKTYFRDEQIRYQIFFEPSIEIYAEIMYKARKFKTKDYEPLLGNDYINALKKYPM